MKKLVHINSITAYRDISHQLPARKKAVYNVVAEYYPHGISSFNIAEILKIPINQVTGRVNELMHDQAIKIVGMEDSTGKTRNRYGIRFESDPLNKYPKTPIEKFCLEVLTDPGIDLFSRVRVRELLDKHKLLK